jgi:hypothetical protein
VVGGIGRAATDSRASSERSSQSLISRAGHSKTPALSFPPSPLPPLLLAVLPSPLPLTSHGTPPASRPCVKTSGLLVLLGAVAAAHAQTVHFAVIGDYGVDNENEAAVANLVKTRFQPEFVVTVGDNNYLGAARIDDAIGKYYHEFIGNYAGVYGSGASSNRFFPALGNHDWYSVGGYSAHTNYFTLPGNERYYDFVRGPVHIFVVNTDPNEPDGTSATSTQALWFSNRITRSTSPWKVVIAQDPPYSSTEGHPRMRWPYEAWGAHCVMSGDAHQYERVMLNGFPYIVNGAGGASLAGFGTPIDGSTVRYHSAHGAMKVTASGTEITYEFWSVANGETMVDRFSQTAGPTLTAIPTSNGLMLRWPTNSAGYTLESNSFVPGQGWSPVTAAPTISGSHFTLTVQPSSDSSFFRLRK